MRTFFESVDLRSRKEMTAFLSGHFRYPTMNSWNRATSYACNLKVDRLGLTFDIVLKLLDMLGTQEFFDMRQELLDEFNAEHRYRWQAAFNGRSGGYLVLYQGELKASNYLPNVDSETTVVSKTRGTYVGAVANRPEPTIQHHPNRLLHFPVVVPIWTKTLKNGLCRNYGNV